MRTVDSGIVVRVSLIRVVFGMIDAVVVFPFTNTLMGLSYVLIPSGGNGRSSKVRLRFVSREVLGAPPLTMIRIKGRILHVTTLTEHGFSVTSDSLVGGRVGRFSRMGRARGVVGCLGRGVAPILIGVGSLSLDCGSTGCVNQLFRIVGSVRHVNSRTAGLRRTTLSHMGRGVRLSRRNRGRLGAVRDAIVSLVSNSMSTFSRRGLDMRATRELGSLRTRISGVRRAFRRTRVSELGDRRYAAHTKVLFVGAVASFRHITSRTVGVT